MPYESAKLVRDCVAAMVPSGEETTLPAEMEVKITQSLGGSYTVITSNGQMLRIAGEDADALGKEPTPGIPSVDEDGKPRPIEDQVWDHLKTCYDPEIPVNIVDLGLIYECKVSDAGDKKLVNIKMTLTAPGCGMGDVLKVEAEQKIKKVPGVVEAIVEIVWDPPWDRNMMSEEAKLHLGMY